MEGLPLGSKLRALRRREAMTQATLAEKLGVSASYLNLIENNRRPLPAALLLRCAALFKLDLTSFAAESDQRLTADLMEVLGDPVFEVHGLTNADVRELASGSPNVARALLSLYRAYVTERERVSALGEMLSDDERLAGVDPSRLPSEEVGDLIQHHLNYFPELEASAEQLWRDAKLESEEPYRGLVGYLAKKLKVEVRIERGADARGDLRRFELDRRVLHISEALPPRSRRFQVAHQIGLLTQSATIERIVSGTRTLTTEESRALARVALASYFAAAVLMPYESFFETAKTERYDLELIAHRYGTSFEQVCHRLTTLRRPGAEGIPFHLVRVDIAGNISKRFSASGIRIARFSGACPRWNVYTAFLTPGIIVRQISRMPDGSAFFCIARTLRSDRGGFHAPQRAQAIGLGCRIDRAREMVYADGVDLADLGASVPVGVSCRTCERLDCAQRAFPPLHRAVTIDENRRGLSFYTPG